MEARRLGTAGLVSSAVGLGTMAFTGAYGPADRGTCSQVIDLAIDMGITLFDAADSYQQAEAETMLGGLLADRRGDVLIAANGGFREVENGRPASLAADPAQLADDCDASLRRLGTDYIDLFYLAGIDPRVPVEESIGALAELVAKGKIRYLGLREPSADQLRKAHAIHRVSALSLDYSFLRQQRANAALAAATALGIGIVACRPLARGLLTGTTSAVSDVTEQAAVGALRQEAAELDLGVARLALAWLLAQRDDVVPVPSTRCPTHLEMNGTTPGIKLDADSRARLSRPFS